MHSSLKAAGLAITALLCGSAVAPAQDAAGKDHPLITRYPGSTITKYSPKAFDEFELPIAKAKPDSNLEKSQHLEGKVTMVVYILPEGRSTLEVHRNYESALTRAGFTPLFTCKGQEGPGSCGPLNGFVHQLHGWGEFQEDEQRYLAAKLSRAEGDVFVALHVDPRYVLLDVVEVRPMETGLVSVDAALKEIAKVLQQNPALKLHVVGHTDNVGELGMNLELSRKRAGAAVQALTTKFGVAAARLRADGVGPLSPVASNDAEDGRAKNRRVELVKQ